MFSLCPLFQFVGVEGLITGIMDMLPPTSAWGSLRREVVAAICCVICFLIDMSMVTEVSRRPWLRLSHPVTVAQGSPLAS